MNKKHLEQKEQTKKPSWITSILLPDKKEIEKS